MNKGKSEADTGVFNNNMEQINKGSNLSLQEQSGCLYQASDFPAVTDNEELKAEAKDEDDSTEDEFFEAHENQDWYEEYSLDKNSVKINSSHKELQCSQKSSTYSFEYLSSISAENASREEITDEYKQQSENAADISNLKLAPQQHMQYSMSSGYVSAAGCSRMEQSQYSQQQVKHCQTFALTTELSKSLDYALRESTRTNVTFQHTLLTENVPFEGNINDGQFRDSTMQPSIMMYRGITNEKSPNAQRLVSSMYTPQRSHGQQEMGVSVPFQHYNSQINSQSKLPINRARRYQNLEGKPNLFDTIQKATKSMEETRDVTSSTEAETSESNTIAVRGLNPSTTEELIRNYFENTGRSGGSKVKEIIRVARKDVTYITFMEKRAAVKVVSRRHSLEGCELQVSIARPPEMLPNSVLVRNLNNVASGEELRNFVETNTALNVQSVRFSEVDETAAVITFQSDINFQEIQSAITKNKLNGESLTVEPVPEIDTVVVRFQDDYNPSEESLTLHFENTRRNGGGEVAGTEVLYDKHYALVTFVDSKVVADVIRKQHIIDGHILTVSTFQECLGVYGGSEKPLFKSVQPVPISEDDRWKIHLIKDSLFFHKAFDHALTEHHACVNWSDPSGSTHLSCSLTPETDGARQLLKTWSEDALKALNEFLKTIHITPVMVTKEEFAEAGNDLAKFESDERVHIMFNKQTEECFIVENTDNNNTIAIVASINRVKQNLHRKKNRKCKRIPVDKGKLLLLHRCTFESKLKDKYPEFLVSYNFDFSCLEMEGLTEEITEMENFSEVTLKKVISLIHSWDSKLKTDFMAHPAAIGAFENACFGNASKTVVLCTVTGFEVHSFDEMEAKTTLHRGQSLVKQFRIPLKDENREVLKSRQWEELKNSILTGSQGLILMQEQDCLDLVGVVTTLQNEVRMLTDFLEENSVVQKSIPIDQVFGQMLQSDIAENIDNLRQQDPRFQIENYDFDGTSAILVKGNITGIQRVEGICHKFTNTLIGVKKTLKRPCLKVYLESSEWKHIRLEIEDKLKCRILEPGDCPSRYIEMEKNDDVTTEGKPETTAVTVPTTDKPAATAVTVPTIGKPETTAVTVPTTDKHAATAVTVPTNSKPATSAVPLPTNSKPVTAAVTVPTNSKPATAAVTVPTNSKPATTAVTVPTNSKPATAAVTVPTNIKSAMAAVTVPTNIKPATAAVTVPTNSKPATAAVTVPTNSKPATTAVTVPTNSKPATAAVTVPTNSKPATAAVTVSTNSKQQW